MKVAELLTEGFSDFSVNGSDAASDLNFKAEEVAKREKAKLKKQAGSLLPDNVIAIKVCEAVIGALKTGLKDRGNAYNTHGTLNVAMVMVEKWPQFRKLPKWKQFAGEVAVTLEAEAKARKEQASEYTQHMYKFAKELEKLAK